MTFHKTLACADHSRTADESGGETVPRAGTPKKPGDRAQKKARDNAPMVLLRVDANGIRHYGKKVVN
jgi:hypothetical protein